MIAIVLSERQQTASEHASYRIDIHATVSNLQLVKGLTSQLACSALGEQWSGSGGQQGGYGSAAARQGMQREADENLASHFVSVQSISDTTTLPQMLEELERHLNRAASLDALILQLR